MVKQVSTLTNALLQEDMCINLHRVLKLDKADGFRVTVNAVPATTGAGHEVFLWRLPQNLSLRQWRHALMGWTASDAVVVASLPGLDDVALASQLLGAMIERGAVHPENPLDAHGGFSEVNPGRAYTVLHAAHLEDLRALKTLEQHGFVECVRDASDCSDWVLTSSGFGMLQHHKELTAPTYIMQHRVDVDKSGYTLYELIEFMESTGWEISLLKTGPPFISMNDHKIMYVGRKPSRAYLLALRKVQEGKAKGPVEHARNVKYYTDILQGGPTTTLRDMRDQESCLAQVEVEDSSSLGSEAASDVDSNDEDDDDKADDNAKDVTDSGGSASSSSSSSPSSSTSSSSSSDAGSGDGDSRASGQEGGAKITRRRHDKSFSWGPFAFTYKISYAGKAGYQVRCPYHARKEKTKCTKTFACSGHDEAKDIRIAKQWCVQCIDAADRLSHMGPRGLPRIPDDELLDDDALDTMLKGLPAVSESDEDDRDSD